MARRSLKPQLNQIRAWVRQGRTDAWIAHQLEVSASELREFRKQHDLTAEGEDAASPDIDLRDEIEAEVEAATAEEVEEEDEKDEEPGKEDGAEEDKDSEGDGPGTGAPRRKRRRGRRGRGRRKEYEASFDHGEQDGYGLWLDASIKDNPVYTEHWAGKREVTVRIEPDQIVIRVAGADESEDSED